MKYILLFGTFLTLSANIAAQQVSLEKGLNAITKNKLKAQLEFLASDWTEGRETGTKGIDMASDYIRSMFMYMDMEPGDITNTANDMMWSYDTPGDYFQSFHLVKRQKSHQSTISFSGDGVTYAFDEESDFNLLSIPSASVSLSAEMVFAGYGLIREQQNYNAYTGLDVNGKIVVVLRGYPGFKDSNSALTKFFVNQQQTYEYYKLEEEKAGNAEKNGAVAIIYINSETDFLKLKETNPLRYNLGSRYEGDEPPEYYHTRYELPNKPKDKLIKIETGMHLGQTFFSLLNINPDDFHKERSKDLSFKLPKKSTLNGQLNLIQIEEPVRVRNVLARIKGKDSTKSIVIGAHYDHLGKNNGLIYNGADDNASGTAAVLTLAKAFKASGLKPEYNILFAAWTAEEKGLLGSYYFAENPTCDSVIFYMNFDMIGRTDPRDTVKYKANMVYTSVYPELKTVTEKGIKDWGLELNIIYKPRLMPRGGSDHTPFALRNIPVSYFMAGWHDAYHQPWDEEKYIVYDNMERIVKASFLQLWEIARGNVIED